MVCSRTLLMCTLGLCRPARLPGVLSPLIPSPCGTCVLQVALPLSRANLGNKSDKDLAGMKRSKSAVRLEDNETVVVDVTRLHRKEVRHGFGCPV
jgi:hypothetical protein